MKVASKFNWIIISNPKSGIVTNCHGISGSLNGTKISNYLLWIIFIEINHRKSFDMGNWCSNLIFFDQILTYQQFLSQIEHDHKMIWPIVYRLKLSGNLKVVIFSANSKSKFVKCTVQTDKVFFCHFYLEFYPILFHVHTNFIQQHFVNKHFFNLTNFFKINFICVAKPLKMIVKIVSFQKEERHYSVNKVNLIGCIMIIESCFCRFFFVSHTWNLNFFRFAQLIFHNFVTYTLIPSIHLYTKC